MPNSYDVIIIGAGAAGLCAARALLEEGVRVRILEARDRIGGRVLTHRDPRASVALELGAEFIHGDAQHTHALLDEARIPYYEADGEQWRAQRGRVTQDKKFFDRVARVFRKLDVEDDDRTFGAFLATKPGGARLAQERTLASRFVQSFHGADVDIISARSLAQQGDPSKDETVEKTARAIGGYGPVIDFLAQDVSTHIDLEHVVTRIEWERGAVRVHARNAKGTQRFDARAVIITLPIGVLQAEPGEEGAVTFDPDPPAIRKAINLMAPGVVLRAPLLFTERFWESKGLENAMFMQTPGGMFTTWWTQFPMRAPVLVAWTGGPLAQQLLAMGPDAVIQHALEELAAGTGVDRRRIEKLFVAGWTHDWLSDPYTRGAYAYARVGGSKAPRALARPVEDTLFMAGEAVASSVANGTVEGALAAGAQAARQYLNAVRGR